MTSIEQHKAKDDLEALIDATRLHIVVEMLASICSEKAAHIETNWQDLSTASPWLAASRQFDSLAQKIYKAGL